MWADLWTDLASYVQAGIALDHALGIVATRRAGRVFKLLQEWRECLQEGKSLSELYARSGQYLMWLPLIRVGEATGDLAHMMRVLGGQAAEWHRHRRDLWTQLAYPLVVTAATVGVCALFFLIVFPRFAAFYEELGLDADGGGGPIRLAHILAWGVGAVLVAGGAAVFGVWRWRLGGKASGRLARMTGVSDAFTFEWAFLVGTMLSAGVSLDETLAHLADAKIRVSGAARHVRSRMLEGSTLPEALGAWPQCSEELLRVVELALWTGRLDTALLVLAESAALRQKRRLELWIRWLEPTLTGVIGLLVLGVFGLLYWPITQIMGMVVS
ncbi:MAG: type II secretion system F family protein [Kyrpidia sp.]|nr:type II secretion system F family protein [Kyrpidia sp.]